MHGVYIEEKTSPRRDSQPMLYGGINRQRKGMRKEEI
jgi:hypothetical protein